MGLADWLKRVTEWPEYPPAPEPAVIVAEPVPVVAEPEPILEPAPPPPVIEPPALAHLADGARGKKIGANIRRFRLALEQCGKGPEREAELRAWLDYWRAQKAAEAKRPEAR